MKITLQRKKEINNTVLGELSINDKFFCYTLEDKIRDVKIKHETCIPEGEYKINLTLSQRFKTILPILLNVPGFEGIRIHAGNTIEDTSGCILVGSAIQGELLLHSKTTLQKLLSIIKTGLKNEELKISIYNPVKEELPKAEPVTKPVVVAPEVIPTTPEVVKENPTKETKVSFVNLLNTFIKWLIQFYKN